MKKAILFLLLAAMLLSALASCQSGGDGKTTEAVTVPQTEAETAAETQPETDVSVDPAEEAAAFDALVADIGGATVENEKAIDEAYLTYWTMSEEARAASTQYDRLQTLRSELTKAYVVKQYKDTRIPHERFIIGVYHIPASTDQTLQALVDCKVDFVWGGGDHELLRKYGLGTFESAWSFYPISTKLTEEEARAAVKEKSVDDDLIWAVDHIDEPTAFELPKYWVSGKVYSEEAFPESAYLANLLPFYVGDSEEDGEGYRQYLKRYLETFGSENDYISFDHYLYVTAENPHGGGNQLSAFLANLHMVSQACNENGKEMLVILQSMDVWKPDGGEGYYTVSANMMRFQAYTAMAFGAKGICWYAPYTWKHFMINEDGTKNENFDKFYEADGDVKSLEPIFMRYTADSNAVISGERALVNTKLDAYWGSKDPDNLKQDAVTGLTTNEKGAALIGHFTKNIGEGDGFMIVPLSNTNFQQKKEQTVSVSFETTDPEAVVTAYCKGVPTRLIPVEGVYTVELHNIDAVFVTVE